jgi:hypothetical protein
MRLLTDAQRRAFQEEARAEAVQLEAIARMRFPLVAAFHAEITGDLPKGCRGLDHAAVQDYGADLFERDARLAWGRARAFAAVARSLSAGQKHALSLWKFGDFRTWPEVGPEAFRQLYPRAGSRLEGVACMTLASEFFSWVAGSLEADAYFCPERHGTYFGGFYMKDMPAMGKRDFDLPAALTGDVGEAFLDVLEPAQRARLAAVIDQQRAPLQGVVDTRRAIAARLRGFLGGEGPSEAELRALGRRYGRLDAELACLYADAFRDLRRTLDGSQTARLQAIRGPFKGEDGTAFLFSDRIALARFPDASFLLGPGH